MKITKMRMTSFRLSDEDLGTVHGYRAGPEFATAWAALQRRWVSRDSRRKHYFCLPYAALAQALCVLSEDLVVCQRRAHDGQYVILSRAKLNVDDLQAALTAWERCLGEPETGALSSLAAGLDAHTILIADVVRRRSGHPPLLDAEGGWPWDVTHWEVAHRLARQALEVEDGRHVELRLDSAGRLLTWGRSYLVGQEKDDSRAMHVISPKIITVPGVEDPVVHLRASLVRLADDWGAARSANAWAELPDKAIVLQGALRREKSQVDGSWSTLWRDHTAEILSYTALEGAPDPRHQSPSSGGPLRTGFRRAPRRSSIGRGVGPWFYERIARHARGMLPSARPLEMSLVPYKNRSAARLTEPVSLASMPTRLRIVCVYHDASMRSRQLHGLIEIFEDRLHLLREVDDDTVFEYGCLEVVFTQPPHSERLVASGDETMWEPWLESWFPQLQAEGRKLAAFVQTDESAGTGRNRGEDPKQALRHLLGKRGVVSQFISETSAPRVTASRPTPEDHAAQNAALDLLRSAGWFLKTFPAEGVTSDTWVVGVYCTRATRRTTRRGTAYLANLVAARAGSNVALGYIPGRKGWVSLHEATADFIGSEQNNRKEDAAGLVERAVAQLRVKQRGAPIILVFNAEGCRTHWRQLSDKYAGEQLPGWMCAELSAVVRIRTSSDEVPRAAGAMGWESPAPAKYTDHRLLRVDEAQGESPAFLFSGSKSMSKNIPLRGHTRYGCDPRKLRQDWHALRTTEILVLDEGRFEAAEIEVELASMCRVGPSWEGQLRWPSPLHLARAVVRNHPHCSIDGDADVDFAADD